MSTHRAKVTPWSLSPWFWELHTLTSPGREGLKEKVCVEGPHPRPQGSSHLWSASGSFSEASSVTLPSPPGSWSFPDKHVHSFAPVLEVGAPALCQDCTYLQCLQVVEPQRGRGTACAGRSGELLHLVWSRGAVGVWSEGAGCEDRSSAPTDSTPFLEAGLEGNGAWASGLQWHLELAAVTESPGHV